MNGRFSRGVAVVVGAGLLSLCSTAVVGARAAGAVTGYQVTASPSLNARSGPGTGYAVVGSLPDGAQIDISCQVQGGTNVGGNATWDRLSNGWWIADYWTNTPSFNSYIPGVHDCNTQTAPPPASYHTTASPTLNGRSGPGTSYGVVGTLAYGTPITISCQFQGGTNVDGNATWDQLSNGWFIADYWTNTPSFNSSIPGVPACGPQPPATGPSGYPYPAGQEISYNPGVAGNCTWGAQSDLHAHFNVYMRTAGNALNWASSAKANGWTVKASPAAPVANGSMAVFQPGVDGAFADGHVAWITAVYSNGTFQIHEMNGTAGLGKWDYRTVKNTAGVSFIYW